MVSVEITMEQNNQKCTRFKQLEFCIFNSLKSNILFAVYILNLLNIIETG